MIANHIATTPESDDITVFIPMKIRKRGNRAMVILPKGDREEGRRLYDEILIQAFVNAYRWRKLLQTGKASTLTDISKKEKRRLNHVSRLYQLNYVAPSIVEAILTGTQPKMLCLQDFVRKAIPVRWDEQMALFGFDE